MTINEMAIEKGKLIKKLINDSFLTNDAEIDMFNFGFEEAIKLFATIDSADNSKNYNEVQNVIRVLFLNDNNGFEVDNPIANLIDVFNTSEMIMKHLEEYQTGVKHIGGKWVKIMIDGNIKCNHISKGRKNDYKPNDYDLIYELISGNH